MGPGNLYWKHLVSSVLGGRDSLLLFFPIWKANYPNSTEHTNPNATRYVCFLFWVKITQIFILTHFANQEDELLKGSDGSLQVSILLSSHHVPLFCSRMANLAHSTAQPRFVAFLQSPGPENPHLLLSSSPRGNTCAVKPKLTPSLQQEGTIYMMGCFPRSQPRTTHHPQDDPAPSSMMHVLAEGADGE